MDKLKYIKLENEDGSYSSSIPLAVDSDYVDVNGNTLTNELANKANSSTVNSSITNLQSQISSLASGSPAGVYATVVALTTADPDHTKIYVVSENGHWYYYNNGWQDGGLYQTAENSDKVSSIEREVNELTNIKLKHCTEEDALPISVNMNGYKIFSTDSKKCSFVFQLKNNEKYYLHAAGVYDRFKLYLTNNLEIGTTCTLLYAEDNMNFKSHENEYEFINSENYKYLIFVNRNQDNSDYRTSVDFFEKVYKSDVATAEQNFVVNGIKTITPQYLDTLNYATASLSRIVKTEDDCVSEAVNQSVGNFQWQTFTDAKSLIIPIKNNYTYTINVVGTFNRFVISVADEYVLNITHPDILNNERWISTTEKTFTFTNSNNNSYLFITLGIDMGNTADFDVEILEKRNNNNKLLLNGIEIVKKEDLINIQTETEKIYTSSKHLTNVATTEDLYDLYDQLIEDNPSYVTKNVLGQNSLEQDLIEYVFTSGDYNSKTVRRSKDATTLKPVILIITAVHGSERDSTMGTYQFFSDLCSSNSALSEIRDNYTYKVVPVVCPYGFDHNQRWNENRVNINRNFSKYWTYSDSYNDPSGDAPADQLETQIIQQWIDDNDDALLFIDFHNSGYTDEISYLAGSNGIHDMDNLKKYFLRYISNVNSYWIYKENFDTDLIFQYTGNFSHMGMSYYYAEDKGITAACLETSNNVNESGLDSSLTIKTAAEVLGNLLIGYNDRIKNNNN